MSSKLNRIVQMHDLIRSGQYPNVARFQERFEVSARTVYDDIAYFKDTLRAPIRYSRSHGGYCYTDPTWVLPTIITTEGELLAFFLSAELARRYLGTVFESPLRSAIAKLSGELAQQLHLDLGQLTQHFTFQAGATTTADPVLLVALNDAIVERHPLEITYFTARSGERNQRLIEPYHLYNVRGDWQVIAFDHLRNQVRNFAVSRIERWIVRADRRFKRDPDFSVEQYLSSGFLAERGDTTIDVAIWFSPRQASYIREREWHPTQRVEEHADGSLTLRFRTGALGEVRRWVMSYGSHAEVLAPPELRDAVVAEVAAMARRYDPGPKSPESSQ